MCQESIIEVVGLTGTCENKAKRCHTTGENYLISINTNGRIIDINAIRTCFHVRLAFMPFFSDVMSLILTIFFL
ncbi:Hypothetical predicted protein [Octopus vulgaris]|uniref:Uncharacterized protein n=1 Tax=Octopus vulgaris TaxID=6645 RepID=A0AA36F1R9_OCTVU|nr:Hypothetical predicted protein [Octopus vulgaris]